MNIIKTSFIKKDIFTLIMISSSAQAVEEEIKTFPIDVIGRDINEQSYMSGI